MFFTSNVGSRRVLFVLLYGNYAIYDRAMTTYLLSAPQKIIETYFFNFVECQNLHYLIATLPNARVIFSITLSFSQTDTYLPVFDLLSKMCTVN